MKRIVLLVMALMSIVPLCLGGSSNDSSKPVDMKIQPKPHNGTILRAPVLNSIEIFYQEVENTIRITGGDNVDGNVYLYYNHELIDYSSEINSIFNLPFTHGTYDIYIEGESWEGFATIQL